MDCRSVSSERVSDGGPNSFFTFQFRVVSRDLTFSLLSWKFEIPEGNARNQNHKRNESSGVGVCVIWFERNNGFIIVFGIDRTKRHTRGSVRGGCSDLSLSVKSRCQFRPCLPPRKVFSLFPFSPSITFNIDFCFLPRLTNHLANLYMEFWTSIWFFGVAFKLLVGMLAILYDSQFLRSTNFGFKDGLSSMCFLLQDPWNELLLFVLICFAETLWRKLKMRVIIILAMRKTVCMV